MKELNKVLILFILVMLSCTRDRTFNKARWLKNIDVNDTNNPRAYMTDDLLKNHLKIGITRDSILAMLGKPYKYVIENRLSKGLEMPDSLSFLNNENLKPETKNSNANRINKFIRVNSQPDTLMLYPIGWSTIDPNFLVIKFDDKGLTTNFWIEQH
ncbi:MAG: hypothetical protein V4546_09625 [Bacteroidota bacterium]